MIGETGWIKRILIPYVGLTQVKCDSSEDKSSGLKCRPSELPFYNEYKSIAAKSPDQENDEPSTFEKKTSEVRKGLFSSLTYVSDLVTDVTDKINLDQAKEWTAYLREEENIVPRTGAIALGGLTGLIFGLRGGIFRKTLYTTVGTLTMASVCYPKEAAVYSQFAVDDSKRYLTIAYNFVYGVKPGDPQKELPTLPALPAVPTSLSDVWTLTSDLGSSVKNLILGSSKETSETKVGESDMESSVMQKLIASIRTLYQEKETIAESEINYTNNSNNSNSQVSPDKNPLSADMSQGINT